MQSQVLFIYSEKYKKKRKKIIMSSAAVVIGTIRVKCTMRGFNKWDFCNQISFLSEVFLYEDFCLLFLVFIFVYISYVGG